MNKTINDNTRNLLFDLGGVVISIEREQCVSRLKQRESTHRPWHGGRRRDARTLLSIRAVSSS